MMKNGQVHFRSLAVYAPKDFMFGRLSTLWTKRLRSINSAYMQERKSTKNEILLISKALGCRSNFFGGFLMKKFSICKIHCLNIEIISWKKSHLAVEAVLGVLTACSMVPGLPLCVPGLIKPLTGRPDWDIGLWEIQNETLQKATVKNYVGKW